MRDAGDQGRGELGKLGKLDLGVNPGCAIEGLRDNQLLILLMLVLSADNGESALLLGSFGVCNSLSGNVFAILHQYTCLKDSLLGSQQPT